VAIDWAARDAAARNVSLTLVHVASGLAGSRPHTQELIGFGEWQRRQGRQSIEDAITIVDPATAETGRLQVKTEVYYSAVVPTLVEMSKDAEMVVVGRRGHGAFGSLLGSVIAGLDRHVHNPVAVIHDEDPLMSHPAQAPVLVGIDGSPVSELATAIAFEEASPALPTIGDPVQRLERVANVMRARKQVAIGPSLASAVVRALAAVGVYDWYMRRQRCLHTVVTNLPGPARSPDVLRSPCHRHPAARSRRRPQCHRDLRRTLLRRYARYHSDR
jgi:nucleotide-binding universal stress UspA family protein